jgi:hypothetical protein
VEVRAHDSFDEFRAIAEPLYRRDPIGNTIELTLFGAGRVSDDSLLLSVWNDGTPVGAFLQIPPYPLACNGIPLNAMESVVVQIAGVRPELTGVRGVRSGAVAFADAWREITGRSGTMRPKNGCIDLARCGYPTV